MPDSPSALTRPPSGLALIVIFLIMIAVVGSAMLIARPLSHEATQREAARSAAVQAQAAAQQAAERERTERERLSIDAERYAANLRAEATARTQNSVLTIFAAGGIVLAIVVVFGVLMFGLNWFDAQQARRTLIILESQRESRAELAGRQFAPPALSAYSLPSAALPDVLTYDHAGPLSIPHSQMDDSKP